MWYKTNEADLQTGDMIGHCSILIKYHSEFYDIIARFNIGSTYSEISYNFDI